MLSFLCNPRLYLLLYGSSSRTNLGTSGIGFEDSSTSPRHVPCQSCKKRSGKHRNRCRISGYGPNFTIFSWKDGISIAHFISTSRGRVALRWKGISQLNKNMPTDYHSSLPTKSSRPFSFRPEYANRLNGTFPFFQVCLRANARGSVKPLVTLSTRVGYIGGLHLPRYNDITLDIQ